MDKQREAYDYILLAVAQAIDELEAIPLTPRAASRISDVTAFLHTAQNTADEIWGWDALEA